MIDWDAVLLGPVQEVFGELVMYLPAVGSSFPITGVYDDAYRSVDLSGMGVTSDMPVVGVRLAEFPSLPRQGDQLTVQRTGATFDVKEVQPDGHGWAMLKLNLVSS